MRFLGCVPTVAAAARRCGAGFSCVGARRTPRGLGLCVLRLANCLSTGSTEDDRDRQRLEPSLRGRSQGRLPETSNPGAVPMTTSAKAKKSAPSNSANDAIKLLMSDHKDVKALFKQYDGLVE